jgi:hypothetical protein
MLRTNPAQPALGEAQPAPTAGRQRIGLLTEFQRLLFLVRAALAAGRRPWFALAMGASAIAVSLLLHNHSIGAAVWHSGAVYASLPLGTELVRLPMSLFLPTPLLPLWGAVLQLVVVLGISELLFGRLVTVVVAAIGHVGSTLVARVILDSIHGSLFGLSPALVHMLDTGPSAAVTAVGAYLLLAARMYRCTLLLVISLLAAALAIRGIDGVEHMVALACGLLAGYFVPRRALTKQQETASLASSTTV